MHDILFLDIDGVLNRIDTRERFNGLPGVDRELLALLTGWLARHPSVKIVLSSMWRLIPEMREHLRAVGLTFIDMTPRLFAGYRGAEIALWLDEHQDEISGRYAILDDNSDMLAGQMAHLVQTETAVGLTEKHLLHLDAVFGFSRPD